MKNTDLSIRIKELRIEKCLSQEELSENSGVSLRTIQRLENGESEPRGNTLKRLANTFEVDYSSLDKSKNNNSIESKVNNSLGKYSWLLFIAYIISGAAFGFLIGLILTLFKIIPMDEIGGMITISLSVLFGAFSIVIKNILKKKQND